MGISHKDMINSDTIPVKGLDTTEAVMTHAMPKCLGAVAHLEVNN